jgi:hypothetical protein
MTFESVLRHLGPSAKPLMDFMDNNMARNLSRTSKKVCTYVMRHKNRWGFAHAPYSLNPDGSFVLATKRQVYKSNILNSSQKLGFGPNSSPYKYKNYSVWLYTIVHKTYYTEAILTGSSSEINAIKKEYMAHL